MSARILLVALGAMWAATACDPTQSNAIAALGGEENGVRPGPTHRPGQPCLTCHDGGEAPDFSIGGTIYVDATSKTPAVGALVELRSADGSPARTLQTNQVGNFYAAPREFTPVYPLAVAVTYRGVRVEMSSRIGRSGSCADCHSDPAGSRSAGHVYIPPDGGIP